MLENLIKNLKKKFRFKDSTSIGDTVIILSEAFGIVPDQINFAFVKSIVPSEKKGIDKIELFMIGPFKSIFMNLIKDFYTGKECFYVSGNKMWICAIDRPIDDDGEKDEGDEPAKIFELIQGGASEDEKGD